MAEEQRENREYQFINEQIVPKRKSKWKKRLGTAGFTLVLAVIFGVVAQAVFLLAEAPLREILGLKENGRQEIELPTPTQAVKPTKTPVTPVPTETVTPEPTKAPEVTSQPPDQTGQITPEPVPTGAGEEVLLPDDKNPETGDGTTEGIYGDWYSYAMFYREIAEIAEEAARSIVAIDAVEISVDWFQETYETRTSTTGLILGNDEIDLLILTSLEPVAAADAIEVQLGGEVVEGRIFASDADYDLAVVAVPLEHISKKIQEQIQVGKLGFEQDIKKGSPVVALGAPNGYQNSIEFGMITGFGGSVLVADGEVPYFTTNLNDYEQGHGFIVNLDGEVLGMITHTHKGNADDGVSTAISLDALRDIIVKLLNNAEILYFGICGENLPPALREASGVPDGVYVKEVKTASPALAAGIKSGDVLVSAGGTRLNSLRDFTKVLLGAKLKEPLEVKLLRTTGDGVKEVTLSVMPAKKAEK